MDIVDKFYAALHHNRYISTILTTFLVIYGSTAAPKLPSFIKRLFSNPIFKVIFLSLIAYSVNRDPKLSILLSVVFIITLSLIEQQMFFEGFGDGHDHNNDHEKLCKDIEFDEKEIREGKNWKNICCCDFKNPPPQYTGACLDRIGDDVDNDDFDYEKHVCVPPDEEIDEENDEEEEVEMNMKDFYDDEEN